jgi:hypothetical protein
MKDLLMKTMLTLALSVVAGALAGQSQQTEPQQPMIDAGLNWEVHDSHFFAHPEKADQIQGERFMYSGLAVDLIKGKMPERTGTVLPGEEEGDNGLQRDAKGNIGGWKILSIKF